MIYSYFFIIIPLEKVVLIVFSNANEYPMADNAHNNYITTYYALS